jgi:parallel beta-helix repeat protein
MKTLQQIEPRTDLQATPAPPGVDTSNANYHFIINQAGSYYLSANLGVTKTNGIQINAEAVTLDLNGFEISRTSGTGGNGIEIRATAYRASVRNGSIRSFAYGINSDAAFALGCAFRDLAVSYCTSYGILTGFGAVLEFCRAHDNSGNAGVEAYAGSTLSNCTAYHNTARYGIFTADGSTLSNCSAYANVGGGTDSAGIATGSGCTVSSCTARSNTSTAPSTFTTGMGFYIGSDSTIQNCTATGNQGDGIHIFSDRVHVTGNNCAGNTTGGQGGGIHATGTANACRIDGNHCTGGVRGIFIQGNDNLVIRNSVQGASVLNYDLAVGNHDAARVSSPGSSFASTSPWANFSF